MRTTSPGRSCEMPSRRCEPPGVEIAVVSPASFRHYGIAYGDGIVNNLRAAPWKLFALPLFLLSFARAARRASRGRGRRPRTLASERVARARDRQAVRAPAVGLGRRACAARGARSSRRLVRRAGVVVCASTGARRRRTRARRARRPRDTRAALRSPRPVGEPEEPPHVLYVGRLSEEKGVRELAAVAAGLPLVVVGDGPLRTLLPQTVGFVPPGELGPVLRARLDRRRPVAARGIRRDRPRGDGSRQARGRLRGRGARRRGRGRSDGPPRAAARSAARCARRSCGCSPTRRYADGWAPRAAAVPASGSRWRPLRTRRSASTTGSRRGRSGPASRRGSGRASGARGARRPR